MYGEQTMLFDSLAAFGRILEAMAVYAFIGALIVAALLFIISIVDWRSSRRPRASNDPPEPR